jgi:hypothetical protein
MAPSQGPAIVSKRDGNKAFAISSQVTNTPREDSFILEPCSGSWILGKPYVSTVGPYALLHNFFCTTGSSLDIPRRIIYQKDSLRTAYIAACPSHYGTCDGFHPPPILQHDTHRPTWLRHQDGKSSRRSLWERVDHLSLATAELLVARAVQLVVSCHVDSTRC